MVFIRFFSSDDFSVPTTLDDIMSSLVTLFVPDVAHALLRAVSGLVSTLFYQYGATRVGAQCHLVFDVTNVSRAYVLCRVGYISLSPRKRAKERSHECERGTQECVRHNNFNILQASPKLSGIAHFALTRLPLTFYWKGAILT